MSCSRSRWSLLGRLASCCLRRYCRWLPYLLLGCCLVVDRLCLRKSVWFACEWMLLFGLNGERGETVFSEINIAKGFFGCMEAADRMSAIATLYDSSHDSVAFLGKHESNISNFACSDFIRCLIRMTAGPRHACLVTARAVRPRAQITAA